MGKRANSFGANISPQILSKKDMNKIINGIYELLREVGVRFDPDPRALDLFSAAGCDVSGDGVVKIHRDLVEESLDSVEKEVCLWDRNGNPVNVPGMSFTAGMGCINVIDIETGKRRSSTREDLATVARVVDALPFIDGISQSCKIVERSDVYGEIDEFNVIASNTTKPITYISEYVESLEAAIEIAAAIRGGLDNLKEKPYFSYSVTQMPLYFSQKEIDQIFLAIENGIPLNSGSIVIAGATSPMTIAGSLLPCIATDFALFVLGQLIQKGCCCLSSSEIKFMDPRTGNFGGKPEFFLGELAKIQIFKSLGLPAVSGAGSSVSPIFDQNCATDIASSMMHAYYSGADEAYFLGNVEASMTYSFHALLYCHELAGFIRRMERGIEINEDTMAMDVLKKVGLKSDYLAERHTVQHCRTELWLPRYFKMLNVEEWEQKGKKDLFDLIDEDLRKILAEHQPNPLPEETRQRIDEVLKKIGVITT
ncbi:MAG: trimethylamine methyltransferase family protein [Desulfobacterales bacterium]|nr:trimethylamine methyltransferase family protein [Desulfobacterales bacterium]